MGVSARTLLALIAAAGLATPAARADMAMGMSTDDPTGSFARCAVVISTRVKDEIAIASSEIANITAAFVCNQSDLGNATVEESAAETAEMVSVVAARAIAQLNVNCFVSGMGKVLVNGMALASVDAESLVNEFATNITELKVCTDCNETAAVVGANFSDIFLPAVANATVSLELATSNDTRTIAVEEFVSSVVEVAVVNFTKVLVSARTGAAAEGCESPPPPRPMRPPAMEVMCDDTEPVPDFGKCAGSDIDVPKACESEDFLCVTRGPNFAACRRDGIPKDDTWEGIVFQCI